MIRLKASDLHSALRPRLASHEPLSIIGRLCRAHPDQVGPDGIGYCERCHMGNAFYREICQQCGAPKPWLYAEEILRDEFDYLEE